ncbi:hypothetical protein [Neomoorella mulderi]|uniref:Uncharacterized protein n=1 Tax=Moorella mulderi DSM 14980 TaxID=1122241 RepID=A0A151AYH2_9FIRM|nr:hypothetical protein [Moorella mulderi]KYH32457.1 hypothetical protein MOMUL_10580 [Moorella mulderi DSM 14980]
MPLYHTIDPKRQNRATKFLAHCPEPVQILLAEVIGAAHVLDHLPAVEQPWVARKMDAAWQEEDPEQALKSLKPLLLNKKKPTPAPPPASAKGWKKPSLLALWDYLKN